MMRIVDFGSGCPGDVVAARLPAAPGPSLVIVCVIVTSAASGTSDWVKIASVTNHLLIRLSGLQATELPRHYRIAANRRLRPRMSPLD